MTGAFRVPVRPKMGSPVSLKVVEFTKFVELLSNMSVKTELRTLKISNALGETFV